MTRRYYDVTLPYSADLPVWPGDPSPTIERFVSMTDGEDANVTRIAACVHYGTHVDAPGHFIANGKGVETMDIDALIGPARVVDVGDAPAITAAVLDGCGLDDAPPRVLFRSTNSRLWDDPTHDFEPDFVAISPDGAAWLVDHRVRLVGIDYLSVETYHTTDFATHKTLLGAGVIALEGLDLRAVKPGDYEMSCLPMKIVGSDGAPARVVLWRDE